MADTPTALQLRLLQTVVEVAAEKNSTLVLPFPVELLRFLEKATEAHSRPETHSRPEADDHADDRDREPVPRATPRIEATPERDLRIGLGTAPAAQVADGG
jgi:hypothetical protein